MPKVLLTGEVRKGTTGTSRRMTLWWHVGVVLVSFGKILTAAEDAPLVEIEDGHLKGVFMETKTRLEKISAFMGIPYAKPPLGELRFKSPVPNEPWKGVLDASKEHAVCPQRNIYTRTDLIEGKEDCLYTNVYTPKTDKFGEGELLPVMVFLHGGGYLCGSGNLDWYGPNVLLEKDVVLVVPNYRLGALGFLSTGDEVSPGNYGLKDQSLVLKWVQKNIAKFGGDKDRVTLFGESAGGASVHLHMLSPLSKGLFSRGISQSGTALAIWTLAQKNEAIENGQKLAKLLGCPTTTSRDMVECLRKVEVFDIIGLDRNFMEWDFDPMIPFKPVIEPNLPEAFLTEHPKDIIQAGNVANVPWMNGLNKDEGALRVAALFGNAHLLDELNENFYEYVSISLLYKRMFDDYRTVGKKIKEFYFQNKKIDNTTKQQVIDMYSDAWFSHSAHAAIKLHLEHVPSPVFYYLFAHRGEMSMSERFGDEFNDYGVCHADELQYMFPFKDFNESDDQMRDLITDLWTNFARVGNPTPEIDSASTVYTRWEPVTSDKLEYLHIGQNGELEMRHGLFKERNEFWEKLFSRIERQPIKTEL